MNIDDLDISFHQSSTFDEEFVNLQHRKDEEDGDEYSQSLIRSMECKIYKSEQEALGDRYQTMTLIGQGGFGKVYQVKTKNDQELALKMSREYSSVEISIREYRKLTQVSHDHIVRVCDLFMVDDEMVGIEMDLMKTSLHKIMIEKKEFPEKIIKSVLVQMCSALEILKVYNIIHRDIKPDNILIRDVDLDKEEINVVLSDFGLARSLDTFTSTGISGTMNFVAPEILQAAMIKKDDTSPFSFASDIFALGVTIYQLMTFDFATSLASISLIQEDLSSFIKSKASKEYPQQLIDIVALMCKHDPNSRITAGEIIRILTPSQVKITDFEKAKSLHGKKEFEEALILLDTIIEADPKNPEFLHQRYLTLKQLNQYEKALEDLNRALELEPNNELCLNSLGVCYKEGKGVEKNWDKAISLFEKSRTGQAFYNLGTGYRALFKKNKKDRLSERRMNGSFLLGAEKGHKLCQQEYGILCYNFADYKWAMEWLTKSDTATSHFYLGRMYLDGNLGAKDACKAYEHFSKSNSVYYLGNCYEKGIGTQKDSEKAFKMYKDNENLLQSKLGLGRMYFNGWEGTKPDFQKSFQYCSEVFKNKLMIDLKYEALYYLAEMYYYAKGIPDNELSKHSDIAAGYYNDLIIYGNLNAKFKIGEIMYKQTNPSFLKYIKSYDFDEVDLLMDCAKEGMKQANIYCGEIFFNGHKQRGNVKNLDDAFAYFSDETVKDDPIALYYLSLIYGEGTEEIPKNTELSLKLLEESGEKGHAQAYYDLARYHEKKNNEILAKKYYFLASDLGSKEAKKKLETCLIA